MDDQNIIQVVSAPHLMRPDMREFPVVQWEPGITVQYVVETCCQSLLVDGGRIVASVNGNRVGMEYVLKPGDHLVLQKYIGGGGAFRMIAMIGLMIAAAVIAPWAAGALAPMMGLGAIGTSLLTGFIGGTIMMVGGMLINLLMPVPTPDTGQPDPTYGWGGFQNPMQAGIPYPVIAGNIVCPPVGLSFYKECINADEDYSEWIYLLLCINNGELSGLPAAANCRVGDIPLASFTDYYFAATTGTKTIGAAHTTALAPFAKVHHYRVFDKQLYQSTAIVSGLLLHFNGVHGSTTITDSGPRSSTWTCVGNAALDTSDPFLGSASLSCPDDTSYIETDDIETVRTIGVGSWTLEFRFYRLSDVDNGIFYQGATAPEAGDVTDSSKNIYYDATANQLRFQLVKSTTLDSGEGLDGENAELAAPQDIAVNYDLGTLTWSAHICLMYDADKKKLGIFLGGALAEEQNRDGGEGIIDGLYDWLYDKGYTPEQYVDYGDLDSDIKGAFVTRIGYAKKYDTTAGTWPNPDPVEPSTVVTELFGNAMFDEFRFTRGMPYSYDGFTPPPSELVSADSDPEEFVIATESKCDSAIVQFEFPALYDSNKRGMHHTSVKFELVYRPTSVGGAWSSPPIEVEISAEKTSPVHAQHEITFPARDLYDIYPRRLTAPPDNNTKVNDSFLRGLDEIIDEFVAYPGLAVAVVGVKASEKLSGQLEAISIENTRNTHLELPTYDGLSTEVVNIANPSGYARMSMTGIYEGANINPTRLVQSEWEAWETYCTEQVNGYNRCTVSLQSAKKGTLYDNAQHLMELTGRAKIHLKGRKYGVVIDKPWTGTPAYTFSRGNILQRDGKLQYGWEFIPKSKITDAILVKFFSRKLRKWDDAIAKAPWYDTLTTDPKVVTVQCPSIAEKQEAQRLAYFIGQKSWTLNQTRWLCCDIAAAADDIQAGDVVWLIDPNQSGKFGGNILHDQSNVSTVRLDQAITMDAATYQGNAKMYIRDGDGNSASYDVLGPWDVETTEVEIDGTVTVSGVEGSADVWGIALPNTHKVLWQVLNWTILEGPDAQDVKYELIVYDSTRFYHPDFGGGIVAI